MPLKPQEIPVDQWPVIAATYTGLRLCSLNRLHETERYVRLAAGLSVLLKFQIDSTQDLANFIEYLHGLLAELEEEIS